MAVKRRRFIHNALIMTAFVFILRIIATAFGIYVSNKIGAEGMGLYQLTSSVYSFAVTLSTSGIVVAVTRLVSEQLAFKNTVSAAAALHRCMILGALLGTAASFLLFFNADTLAIDVLQDERVILSLKILAAGLPFLSVAAVLRGYFLGEARPLKAVSGDFAEEFFMIAATLPLLPYAVPKEIEATCAVLVIGSAASEILSCLYALILWKAEKNKSCGAKTKGITKSIFLITAPIAVSSYIRSALNLIENLLIPKGLRKYGASGKDALAEYGIIKGMAMPILFFPSAVLSAFSNLLIPEISYANALDNQKRIYYITSRCIKVTLLFSLFVAAVFIAFSNELALLFYSENGVGKMLMELAPLIPLLYLDQIVDSILKGLNQQISSMKYNTADAVMRTVLVFLLVPRLGINGYIIMLYAGTIFNASLSLNRLIKVSRVKIDLSHWVIFPIIGLFLSCAAVHGLRCGVILSLTMTFILYAVFIFLCGSVKKTDIKWLIHVFYKKTNQ